MPELTSENLDLNTPISSPDESDPVGGAAIASQYFEDYLFKIRTDLAAINAVADALTADTDAYTPTNVTPDRSYDADATTVAELADVLGTLIADLQAKGVLS